MPFPCFVRGFQAVSHVVLIATYFMRPHATQENMYEDDDGEDYVGNAGDSTHALEEYIYPYLLLLLLTCLFATVFCIYTATHFWTKLRL